jgi:hypothetical protein
MSPKPLLALLAVAAMAVAATVVVATLSGCTQLDAWMSTTSGRTAPATAKDTGTRADSIYVNSDAAPGSRDLRNIYIAPANLANMQVIQPEGATADIEWWLTDSEDSILQQAIVEQFAAALGYGSAFYIVATPQEAQIVVDTAVVAIHPNVTRSASAAKSNAGGAITVSIAAVNAASGAVLARVVDTRSTDNIWAFNQVKAGDPAFSSVFRAWGDSVRQGLLQLQGR